MLLIHLRCKGLVKQFLNKDINVEQAVGKAQSLCKKKGSAIGQAAYSTLDAREGTYSHVFLIHRLEYDHYVCLFYGEFVYATCIYENEIVRLNTFRYG